MPVREQVLIDLQRQSPGMESGVQVERGWCASEISQFRQLLAKLQNESRPMLRPFLQFCRFSDGSAPIVHAVASRTGHLRTAPMAIAM